MTIDKNYFLSRLNKGEDIDDIGQSVADMMNEAVAEYEAVQEAKKRTAQKDKAKRAAAAKMIDAIKEFAALEGLDPADFEPDEDELEELVQSFTSMFQVVVQMKKLGNILDSNNIQTEKIKPSPKASKSDDEVLADFIQSLIV